LSNYLECCEEGTNRKKTLRQAVICKVLIDNSQICHKDNLESVNASDYKGCDAVFKYVEKGNCISSPRQYHVFSRNRILPEYVIEYSTESDWDKYTTQLEKLLVGNPNYL
jgi:hypothetical protein